MICLQTSYLNVILSIMVLTPRYIAFHSSTEQHLKQKNEVKTKENGTYYLGKALESSNTRDSPETCRD